MPNHVPKTVLCLVVFDRKQSLSHVREMHANPVQLTFQERERVVSHADGVVDSGKEDCKYV